MPPKGSKKVLQVNPETGLAESVFVDGGIEPEVNDPIELQEGADIDSEMLTKTDMMQYVRGEAHEGRFNMTTKTTDTAILMANVGYVYEKLAKGYPISQICRDLQISRVTWYYVKEKSKYFSDLVELAQKEHIENVKFSLIKKTEDRYVDAEQVTPSGRVIKFKKYVPADFNAIKFFLLNKASDEFKEKQEIEVKQTNIVVDILEDVEYVDATPSEESGDK